MNLYAIQVLEKFGKVVATLNPSDIFKMTPSLSSSPVSLQSTHNCLAPMIIIFQRKICPLEKPPKMLVVGDYHICSKSIKREACRKNIKNNV